MAAEWTDDNTRILVELFVKQVRKGNRPNTHLTPNAYEEVANEFRTITRLEYKQPQLKNKWDKLKNDFNIFKKIRLRETGGGWDSDKNTVKQDAEWWKKTKNDIPGSGKFRKQGLRNEEGLKVLFEDITSDGTHIRAVIAPHKQVRYIGRTGAVTQNVMAICDFDMHFTYASIGQPGAMHDTSVLYHAIDKDKLTFPHPPKGKYYLVDAGYPN
ncbi:hypothetical protein ACQ4PT_032358 [Festuca glaucescens]